MVETTDTNFIDDWNQPPVDDMGRSLTEYDYCPVCEEKVDPVIDGGLAVCPYCGGDNIYKPLYRYEVTRHVWKYCTVLAGDSEEAKTIAEQDGEWEESPDYEETVGEANLVGERSKCPILTR